MTKRRGTCHQCGAQCKSTKLICRTCHAIELEQGRGDVDEDEDIVQANLDDYREELSEMHARSDDDGWAYADDPTERRADPSPMRILREGI